ncbi:hypothetical protein WA026_016341 [Henosepilachna vigintioctopunctata]|uniref:Uncharacterized protein n=1 Tax=Henosepilachna vigintioctopunctata TaxID=420089 RepID=A0AAW1UFZ8_9CUCU
MTSYNTTSNSTEDIKLKQKSLEEDDSIKIKIDPGLEKGLLKLLSEVTLLLPIFSEELSVKFKTIQMKSVKLSTIAEFYGEVNTLKSEQGLKRKREFSPEYKNIEDDDKKKKDKEKPTTDIMFLLSLSSTKERESIEISEEISEILSRPTA